MTWVKKELVELPKEKQLERLSICNTCEFKYRLQHQDFDRCGKCGCDISRTSKWAQLDCPIGLWPKIESEQ